jgi:putative flavoprotein involved in K+ transport
MVETIETVIVGAGQAGLSLSYYLSAVGREHLVLEKAEQAGEAWRSHRWDSFTLVTPNWAFKLPGGEYKGTDPGGFMPGEEIVRRFEAYAAHSNLPIRCRAEVTRIEADDRGGGYTVQTRSGDLRARNVVIATGLLQMPKIPPFATDFPRETLQLGADQYRRPETLPAGGVLVVGAGQSGCQIAEELYQSGRQVFLCASGAPRVPRRYRGRDIFEWLQAIGFFDRTPDQLLSPQARFGPNPQVSGKNGGHSLNLHQFYRDGVTLLGHLHGIEEGRLVLAPDLQESLAKSDQAEKEFLSRIDALIDSAGLDAPEEEVAVLKDGQTAPQRLTLDLAGEGIRTVIWAGGFRFDYSLVRLPVFDPFGFPVTQRGVTQFPGLFFLGMPWLYKVKSGLLFGVGEDAEYLAGQISAQAGS